MAIAGMEGDGNALGASTMPSSVTGPPLFALAYTTSWAGNHEKLSTLTLSAERSCRVHLPGSLRREEGARQTPQGEGRAVAGACHKKKGLLYVGLLGERCVQVCVTGVSRVKNSDLCVFGGTTIYCKGIPTGLCGTPDLRRYSWPTIEEAAAAAATEGKISSCNRQPEAA